MEPSGDRHDVCSAIFKLSVGAKADRRLADNVSFGNDYKHETNIFLCGGLKYFYQRIVASLYKRAH